jgi:hypothetical protein
VVVVGSVVAVVVELAVLFFGTCNDDRINSGTYIGYVKDILEIIQQIYELNPKNDADDQVLMIQYCQKTNNRNSYNQ